MPILGRLYGPAQADGGDLCWLDERTLIAGRGYRTNAEAHRQLAELVAADGAELLRADLPHDRGAAHVLHLLSVVSPVADDLAVVYEPLAPVPLLEELDARGVRRILVDPGEYETLGSNVLAVRPGVVVVVDGMTLPRLRDRTYWMSLRKFWRFRSHTRCSRRLWRLSCRACAKCSSLAWQAFSAIPIFGKSITR